MTASPPHSPIVRSAQRPLTLQATHGLLLVVLLWLACTVAAVVIRPALASDCGWGFLIWDGMRRGAVFNGWLIPDPTDISRDIAPFITWWSPGQYLVPGALELQGADLGLAVALATAVASALGLIGWWQLYRAFGFDQRIVLTALLVVASSRFFNLSFSIYNGGEVLLFASAPWYFLLVWRLRRLPWWSVAPLAGGAAVLVFMKLTGLMFAGEAIGAAALCGEQAWRSRDTLRRIAVAGATLIVLAVAFRVVWLAEGGTPASAVHPLSWARLPTYGSLAATALLGSSFSFGDFLSYLFLHPGRPIFKSLDMVYGLFLPFAVVAVVVMWRNLRGRHGEYLRFALLAAAASAVAMTALWVMGTDVSPDDRHLRPVSLMLLVGFVAALAESRARVWRIALGLVCLGSFAYGLTAFVSRERANMASPLGSRGFRHLVATPDALRFVHAIDVLSPGGKAPVLYVPVPEIGLEARKVRVFGSNADFEPLETLRARQYHGRVDRLYVLIQRRLVTNGKADAVLRSFVDYPVDGWRLTELGDFVAFSQGEF